MFHQTNNKISQWCYSRIWSWIKKKVNVWCAELMQCSSFHVHKMIEIKVNTDSPNLPFTLIGEYQKSTTYLCLIFCVYNLLSLIHGKLSQLYAIIALSVIELINTKINNLKHFDRALMCLIDPRCHWGCLCRWKLFEEIQKIFCHCPHQDWPPERDPNRLTGWRRSVLPGAETSPSDFVPDTGRPYSRVTVPVREHHLSPELDSSAIL